MLCSLLLVVALAQPGPAISDVWAIQRGAVEPALVTTLREAKRAGLAHLEQIVQDSTEATPEFRRRYLAENVCYDLDPDAKQGIRRFQEYLFEMGILKQCHDLRYIA